MAGQAATLLGLVLLLLWWHYDRPAVHKTRFKRTLPERPPGRPPNPLSDVIYNGRPGKPFERSRR